MGIEQQDTDVFRLLKNLKDTNGMYPQELLAARRQGYLRQVAEVSAGAGLAAALKTTIKSTQGAGAGSLPSAGALLEGLLVVAIIAEASTVAYFYRDKIAQFIQNGTSAPKVEEVAHPPAISSPLANFEFTPTPFVTADLTVTVTETITPVGTPSQLVEQPTTSHATGQGSITQAVVPTQGVNQNDNNGNHYGLTPKPVRTTEPGNNNIDTQDHEPRPTKTR
jgi:hypothetical protein